MDKHFITNHQVLELSALLRYESNNDYNKYSMFHKSTVASASIGLTSLVVGLVSTINKAPDLAEISLATGLYGSIGAMGLSGICEKRQLEAYEKKEISDHIINAIIYGADFSQCKNLFEVLNIVGDCYLKTQSMQNDSDEKTKVFDYFYKYPTAYHICETALNKDLTQKEKLNITQTSAEIYSYICYQQAILPSSQLEEISMQINTNKTNAGYVNNLNENKDVVCNDSDKDFQSTQVSQSHDTQFEDDTSLGVQNSIKLQQCCSDQSIEDSQTQ